MKRLLREALISWHSWWLLVEDEWSQKHASKRDRHAVRAARLKSQRATA